ncbi:unnamed protein product [Ceutorhynchus assimilis]|uniref:Ig-like domain-containing protein n=1 Tax=Ceutorhynchus assimilis TaxID=467358 RepID=A0A9P0DHN4_9CUCU|nr:unnamed protein product [Ceutorhynchus assimilis]
MHLWHFYTFTYLLFQEAIACSVSCICKWKNGKRTADCFSKSLNDLPDTLDPETQVLDFSDNNLGKLSKEIFVKKQLVNLQRLYLSKCRINSIHKETFAGLTNLVEMDLSYNFLENVPTGAFPNCPSLMKLTLSSNPIKEVKKLAFNHLSYLNTLELSDCEIADVQDGAFQGLHSLEWLHLTSNRLKTIQGPHSLPKTLKGIELQKNPWTCDCYIQDLRDWLANFHIPSSMEPVCTEPKRLQDTLVKSVPVGELACLPEVQPTTLYLELTEGKNVSLLCHIHAVPEATVSWWFDGQLLQNNTNITPGMRLVYFVEEGSENKQSELFIYNANSEDNGTYVCHAENAAGSAQSNFTLKIVLKEEPIVIIVSFSVEYLLCAVVGMSVVVILLVIVIIGCVIKCHRKSRLLKRNQTKEVSLHLQQTAGGGEDDKDSWAAKSFSSSPLDQHLKQNLTPTTQTTTCTAEPEEICFFGIRTCDEQFASTMSPLRINLRSQAVSPLSLRRYQLEQNPDLINGTESIGCRRSGDGEDVRHQEENSAGVSCIRRGMGGEFYTSDQGGGLDICHVIDSQGYPVEYGLPKMSTRTSCGVANESFYRTLPSNRMKRHSAANPLKRYSREVEFLSRSVDTPYDHYHTNDIRYTADGYPVSRQVVPLSLLSPPTSSNNTPSPASGPCCSVNWPPYLQTGHQQKVTKRCASAQTDTEDECDSLSVSVKNESVNNIVNNDNNDVLTESPDEGYEGEPSVV